MRSSAAMLTLSEQRWTNGNAQPRIGLWCLATLAGERRPTSKPTRMMSRSKKQSPPGEIVLPSVVRSTRRRSDGAAPRFELSPGIVRDRYCVEIVDPGAPKLVGSRCESLWLDERCVGPRRQAHVRIIAPAFWAMFGSYRAKEERRGGSSHRTTPRLYYLRDRAKGSARLDSRGTRRKAESGHSLLWTLKTIEPPKSCPHRRLLWTRRPGPSLQAAPVSSSGGPIRT